MSTETETSTSPALWFFGIFAALAVFVVVGVYSSRMARDTTGYDEDQAQIRYAKLAKLQAADEKTLSTTDWVDKDKGTVRIPIDEAMTEEIDTLKAKPVAAGIAIPGAAAVVPNTLPATNAPTDNVAAPAAAGTAAANGTASTANPPTAKTAAKKTSPPAPTPPTSTSK